jgi:hypothetical protein
MSLLAAHGEIVAQSSPALAATKRLAVLDELRVPYQHPDVGSGHAWASLSAGEPNRALHWFVGEQGEPAAGWSLGSLRLWGRVASDEAVEAFVTSLPGKWSRETPIVDLSGTRRSSTWRSGAGGTVLPFDPDELIANLRSERYLSVQRSRGLSLKAFARRAYYRIRPLMPRRCQIAVRRAYSRVQARTAFPRWPVERTLHDLTALVLQRVADAAGKPVPYIASWPRGRRWALVLTHDVETAAGRDAIEVVRAVEEASGYRSAWNLVPERYAVKDSLVERLTAEGCEVGVHGLRHDGRDLESVATLERRLPEMRRWARRWGAVGFRSPATHRVWEWMPKLGFDYDSSYPDTDPFEPMSGGCCSWLPFFNDGMVELPITLTQDHTLLVILGLDESVWLEKAKLLRAEGGMALAVVHPDYMRDVAHLRAYARFLGAFRDDPTVWTPLPREVADWWRRRATTSLRVLDGRWEASGPAREEVAIAFAEPAFAGSPAASLRPEGNGVRSQPGVVATGAPPDRDLAERPGPPLYA